MWAASDDNCGGGLGTRLDLDCVVTIRHDIPQFDDCQQIVNVTVDALSHTRILQAKSNTEMHQLLLKDWVYEGESHLYLHGNLPTVVHGSPVYLSNGGCSQGSGIKLFQLLTPFCP